MLDTVRKSAKLFLSSTSYGCGVQRAIFYPKIACNLAFQYIVVVWKHGKEAKAFLLIPFMHKTKRSHYRVSKINILGHPVLCTQLFNLQRHQNYHFEKLQYNLRKTSTLQYDLQQKRTHLCKSSENDKLLLKMLYQMYLTKLTKDESFSF